MKNKTSAHDIEFDTTMFLSVTDLLGFLASMVIAVIFENVWACELMSAVNLYVMEKTR